MLRKSVVSLLIAVLLLSIAVMPATAGGPDGPNVWYAITLVQIVTDHGKQTEVAVPYGADGYQLRPGMLVKLKLVKRGQIEQEPADAQAKFYAEPGDGVRCHMGKNQTFRVNGSGRIYFHASVTAQSVKYHRIADISAVVAESFSPVSLKLVQDQWAQGEGIWVAVYCDRPVSGQMRVTQGDGTLTATFTTELGTFSETIQALTPITYLRGTSYVSYWAPTDDESGGIGYYTPMPDGILTTGLAIGPVPPSAPESNFTVGFRAIHP